MPKEAFKELLEDVLTRDITEESRSRIMEALDFNPKNQWK